MQKIFISLTLCLSILFSNVQPAHAVISETADLAIGAAAGLLQTDDKQLEQEIISGLQNPAEVEKLRNYIEKTRPLIQKKTKSFNDTWLPVLYFLDKIPLIGGATVTATLNGYIFMYEKDLKDDADTPTLKKFAELREHNIDAGQGLFEIGFDMMTKTYDKDTSSAVVFTDAGLFAAKGKQQSNRYKSSAAAIAAILEFAGIEMQPEDVGDICSRHSNSAPKSETTTKNTTPPVAAPTDEHWFKDSNGVYIWNPQPNPNETVNWSGDFVQDGNYKYANGAGVVTWYLNGEFEQKDEGTFKRGQRDGKFKHTFPSGRTIYSNWHNGKDITVDDAKSTFIFYHDAITSKNFSAAYDTLTDNQRQRVGNFDSYIAGFSTTISSHVDEMNLIEDGGNSMTFSYTLTARDNFNGGVKVQTFSGEVTLIQDGGLWYIDFAKSKKTGERFE